jgi:hypothetical protein
VLRQFETAVFPDEMLEYFLGQQKKNFFTISYVTQTLRIARITAGLMDVCTQVAYFDLVHKLRIVRTDGFFYPIHFLRYINFNPSITRSILLLNFKLIQLILS